MRHELAAAIVLALSVSACSHMPPPQMKTGTVPVTIGNGGRTATFHYLGAGGWMIRRGNDAVLLAPFFSNPGMIHLALGADSNPRIVRQHMQRVQDDLPYVRAIVAGHAHYDHIMDLPTVLSLPTLNADAPLLGGPTVCNTLDSALGNRSCIRMTETPTYATPGIKVRAYFSEHAAHVLKTKLFNGHYLSPLPHVPSHGFRWREGETLAYLIDFLDARGRRELRIWYVDASPAKPYGMPDADTLRQHRVDIAIFCVGSYAQQERYPEDYLDLLQPRHSLLGHWESFFRRASLPSRTLPFTDVPEFLRRMGGWGYTLPERHAVVVVEY